MVAKVIEKTFEVELVLLLMNTFSVLSLQMKKLRWHRHYAGECFYPVFVWSAGTRR